MSITHSSSAALRPISWLAIALLTALVLVGLPSRPALATEESPVLAEIDASHDALLADYEVLRAERHAAARVASDAERAAIGADRDAEAAGIRSAAGDAARERADALAADIAALEADAALERAAVIADYDARRAALIGFIDEVIGSLGPEDDRPTKDELRAAEDLAKDERDAAEDEQEAVFAQEELDLEADELAALRPLEQEIIDAQAVLDARVAELTVEWEDDERVFLDEIAGIEADGDAIIGPLEAERDELIRQREAIQRPIWDAAVEDGASEDELDDLHDLHRDEIKEIKDAFKDPIDEEKDRVKDRTDRVEDRMDAREDVYDDDIDAAEDEFDAIVDRVEAQVEIVEDSFKDAADELKDSQNDREDRLELRYRTVIDGIEDGRDGLQASLADSLTGLDDEQNHLIARIDRRLADRVDRLNSAAERTTSRADSRLRDDLAALDRRTAAELDREDDRLERDLAGVDHQIDRQIRLAEAEHYALTKRAEAFLSSGQFESLDATYDPATDDGSPYNVAKRIRADHVDSTGTGVDVALIDTGVVDVEGLSAADVIIGPDFSFEDANPDLRGRDTNGHGTHMAGIIVGRDQAWVDGDHERSAERFIGVAPDARLVSLKVGSADGSVDVTQIIAAINWTIDNRNADGLNIRVINLSFGTDSVQDHMIDPLSHAVERAWHAGIVVVVAAGNDGWEAQRLTNPAQNPYVIAVAASQAASGHGDVPSGFSNGTVAERTVDLAAPGRSIVSLRVPGSYTDEKAPVQVGERFIRGSGTSQAAAVVSGSAALLLSARPELTPDQVKYLLMDTAHSDDDPALVGAGYIDIEKAMREDADGPAQDWPRSTGEGSLDGSRGTVRVVREGIVLEGEQDIFGNDWSGSAWSQDSWSGSAWSGSAWSGSAWSGSAWSGSAWSGSAWSGSSWSSDMWAGSAWSGSAWSGSAWSGSSWSGSSWSGSSWSGSAWSAGGWFGAGWSHARGVVD